MKIKQILFSIFLVLIFSINANAYNKIELGPEYFPQSTRGRPISLAYIYVGLPDTDPEIVGNQKTLYVQEEDGTIVGVTQPIRTSAGGIPLYDSSPVTLLVNGDYSLKILNSSETQIYYVPNRTWDTAFKSGNYYYPDYSAADQGVTGDNNTVKYYVDTIGVSEYATIVLLHNSGGNNTDYVFSTDETIPSNIELKIENGARLDPDTAKVVTINSPAHLVCGNRQEIKTGVGTLAWTNGGTIYSAWWGDTGDGVTDDTDDIQESFDSISSASTIIVSHGTHISTGLDFAPPNDCRLVCEGIIQDDSAGIAFTIGDTTVNRRYKVDGLKVLSSAIDQTVGRIGVLVKNVQESILNIRDVEGYNTGIKFYGMNTQGCVHNETHLGLVFNNKYSLYLYADDGGWCNENSFYGGRFSWVSTTPSYDGFRHLWIDHYATHPLNSNKFYSLSFEGGKTAAGGDTLHAIYCEGWGNSWYGMRFEMTGGANSGRIEFTANTKNNVIYESYGVYDSILDASGVSYLTDDGTTNTIWGYYASKLKGISDDSLLILENVQGDAYNVLSVIQTSTGNTKTSLAGDGSAKFGDIEIDGDSVISQEGADAALVVNSSGTKGLAINWGDGVGTGGITVYDGAVAHNYYFSAHADGLRVSDGAGTVAILIDPDGDIHMNEAGTAKIYFDATHYLYLSGNDIYWWNGGAGTKLN